MKKNLKVKLCLLALLASGSSVWAATVQRDTLSDIERTQRLIELRQKQDYINQQLMYPNRSTIKVEKDVLDEVKEGEKYLFTNIQLVGTTKLKRETDKVIKEYINTKMGKEEIYNLLVKLSNVFLVNGYSTTIVTLKSGNVNKGELIYEVKEGKVRNVEFMNKKEGGKDKLKLGMAFPMRKGDLLSTRDMDQGIENMNVGGNNNVAEVTPTEEFGYSDIIIEENYSPTGFSLGMDNSGYKDKGRYKVNLGFTQDNLLGINDVIRFNYIERLTDDRDKDRESNYDLGVTIPIGYWKFAYNYNLGDNYNTYTSDIGSYASESRAEKHKVRISRVISRGQYQKTTIHGGFTIRDNKNTLNDLLLEVSSKKYTNAAFSIDHTNRFLGGTIFGMLEYERGVPWFGSEIDPSPLKEGDYKIEYDKLNFNLDWLRFFSVKDHGFQYKMGIGGSYSDDRLLAVNQFTMGDEYTVRGFKESSVAGNKGVYINNTLTYMGTENMNKYLAAFKPFIGLDAGVSRDRDLPTSDKIVGMALGFRFDMGNLHGSFTYGIPLRWAPGMPRETNPIYVNLSYIL